MWIAGVALLGCPADEHPPTTADTGSGTIPPLAPLEVSFSVEAATDNPDLRLAWRAVVSASRPVRVTLDLVGGGTRRAVAFTTLADAHELPVVGLRADTDYLVSGSATDASGEVAALPSVAIHTEPLPPRFPLIDVLVFDPERVAFGYTLLDAKVNDPWVDVIVLDPGLQPVWILEGQDTLTDTRFDPEGSLWMLAFGGIVKLDLLGRPQHQWGGTQAYEPFVDLPGYFPNHEAFPDGEGGFYAIANQFAEVPAYPTTYVNPYDLGGPATLSDTLITHVQPDGTVDVSLSMLDRLQSTRISFDALDFERGAFQWGHANSLCVDPTDGGFLIGLRHQDALAKVSASGELRWILGDPAGWAPEFVPYLLEPVGDVVWPYHAHGACFEADGSIVLFDNNNHGHTPYTPEPPDFAAVARARAYRVDEGARTVTLAGSWEATATGPLSSQAIGDADLLPGGNILADFGWVNAENGVSNTSVGWGDRSARIVEWAADGTVVSDLRVRSNLSAEPAGWGVYRVERLPQLYPSTGAWGAEETWIAD